MRTARVDHFPRPEWITVNPPPKQARDWAEKDLLAVSIRISVGNVTIALDPALLGDPGPDKVVDALTNAGLVRLVKEQAGGTYLLAGPGQPTLMASGHYLRQLAEKAQELKDKANEFGAEYKAYGGPTVQAQVKRVDGGGYHAVCSRTGSFVVFDGNRGALVEAARKLWEKSRMR